MQTIGEWIEYRRNKLHMSQRELAKQLHVSASTISRWEHGQSTPGTLLLFSAFNVLGIPEFSKIILTGGHTDESGGSSIHQKEPG